MEALIFFILILEMVGIGVLYKIHEQIKQLNSKLKDKKDK